MIRAWANVSMFCSTIVNNQAKHKNPSDIKREDLICKIHYVAQGKHIHNKPFKFLHFFFFNLNYVVMHKLFETIWPFNF